MGIRFSVRLSLQHLLFLVFRCSISIAGHVCVLTLRSHRCSVSAEDVTMLRRADATYLAV